MTRSSYNNSSTLSNADFDQARAEAAVRELLIAVGENPDRTGWRKRLPVSRAPTVRCSPVCTPIQIPC